jgi:hypothetical protein
MNIRFCPTDTAEAHLIALGYAAVFLCSDLVLEAVDCRLSFSNGSLVRQFEDATPDT